MPIILNGTTGITTPGITNTGPFTFQGVVELPAGAVGAPSLTTTGDTNTGIYFPAADTIAFTEGGVESARFDSSGRFLVKTTSNTQSVVVNAIELGGSGAADTAQPHSFIRANVGTTADYSGYLVFARSRGTTDGATTIVASGDRLGMIRFSGANGTSFSNAAEIYAAVDGTPGASNDMPGRIMFATSSDGSATPTERMRLDSSGALLIGGVGTTKSVYAFNVINDSTFNYGGNAYRIASIRSGSGDQRGVEFGYDATSGVGVIAGATQGAGTGLAFWTYNGSAWGERARITVDGNFGVGTAGPTYKIEGWVANSGTLQNGLNITNGANADFTVRIKTGETWIGPSTSTPFVFVTNSTERARIVGNGDFGIGTSGPAFKLDVSAAGEVISGTATTGSNMRGIRIYNTTTATTNNAIGLWLATGPHQAGIASFRADAGGGWDTTLAFYTHGAATSALNDCYERMRITGEGNVGIGTTTPTTYSLSGKHFEVDGSSGGYSFIHARTTNVRGFYAVNESAGLTALFTYTNHPLTFGTNNTERARITSGGNLLVGGTADHGRLTVQNVTTGVGLALATPSAVRQIFWIPDGYYGYQCAQTIYADGGKAFVFANAAGTEVGTIVVNNASTAYNTTSDYRLKDEQKPLTGSGAFIDAIKPKEWIWKTNGERGVGFIAHELADVSPSSVSGEKDGMRLDKVKDENGEYVEKMIPNYQSVSYSSGELIANLVAEVQSLRARLAAAGI